MDALETRVGVRMHRSSTRRCAPSARESQELVDRVTALARAASCVTVATRATIASLSCLLSDTFTTGPSTAPLIPQLVQGTSVKVICGKDCTSGLLRAGCHQGRVDRYKFSPTRVVTCGRGFGAASSLCFRFLSGGRGSHRGCWEPVRVGLSAPAIMLVRPDRLLLQYYIFVMSTY
ncbi:hypothetical protein BC835DRAFT_844025 [Cytidiella melzeri]|nr:hypothetical protein BC835DRAFT_844025 [Cytidiella melzeri]